jgi:hypothetical protein
LFEGASRKVVQRDGRQSSSTFAITLQTVYQGPSGSFHARALKWKTFSVSQIKIVLNAERIGLDKN